MTSASSTEPWSDEKRYRKKHNKFKILDSSALRKYVLLKQASTIFKVSILNDKFIFKNYINIFQLLIILFHLFQGYLPYLPDHSNSIRWRICAKRYPFFNVETERLFFRRVAMNNIIKLCRHTNSANDDSEEA